MISREETKVKRACGNGRRTGPRWMSASEVGGKTEGDARTEFKEAGCKLCEMKISNEGKVFGFPQDAQLLFWYRRWSAVYCFVTLFKCFAT